MINDKRGELMKFVPPWVNVLTIPKAYSMIERPLTEVIKSGFIRIALARVYAKLKFRRYVKKNKPKDGNAIFSYVSKYVTPFLPPLKLAKYDLAISFLTPHDIVHDKIDATKKVCWIHTDYSSIDIDKNLELSVWRSYDQIVSISAKVTQTFCNVFPKLKDKIIEIEPILSPEMIRQRSMDMTPKEMNKVKDEIIFLTIGRYCYAKNLECIPTICRLTRQKGVNLKWFIIGYGGSDEYIRNRIKVNDIEDHVIILGKKENPYPYISNCDWYVQPSRYEGNSITVKEAHILGKPVIITDYPTAGSQLKNGIDGMIVPCEPEKTAEGIVNILKDENLYRTLNENIARSDYSNKKQLQIFYNLLPSV